MIVRFFCLLLIINCTACVSPTAKAPSVMEQELAEEATTQQAFANREKLNKTQYSSKKTAEMGVRLATIGAQIQEGGLKLCQYIAVDPNHCVYKIALVEQKAINAYADGEKIFVTTAMMNFAKDDEELASILGHEYAHNLMGHVDAQTKNSMAGYVVGLTLDILASAGGIGTGSLFTRAGSQIGSLRYSQGFENEADYIGVYIMANAGLPIDKAPNIWRRFSAKDGGQGIYTATTHPTNPHRFIALTKAIKEIQRKEANNQPLIPDFHPQEEG